MYEMPHISLSFTGRVFRFDFVLTGLVGSFVALVLESLVFLPKVNKIFTKKKKKKKEAYSNLIETKSITSPMR